MYAETFRTLGHQIHHVQDAATPAHTRNDWHLCVYRPVFCPDPDEFHFWGESDAGQTVINTSNPAPFNTSLLNQSCPESCPNPSAPVPIARIIDSQDADIGTLALTPGISMGIAEYSSANFYSDDTINSPNFLSPLPSQVEVHEPELDATGQKLRRYVYFRSGFGEQNYPLALASALAPYVIDPLATPTEGGLDDKVFEGYGAKLFPRAIGYSAGLIDYFFRGQISVVLPVFDSAPPSNPPTSLTVTNLYNATPDEETGDGIVNLVLQRTAQFNTSENLPQYVVSNQVNRNVSRSPQNVTFPFGSLPFPTTMGPECFPEPNMGYICGSYARYDSLLVYRGPLGGENDSVMVSRCSVIFGRELYTEGLIVFLQIGGAEGC